MELAIPKLRTGSYFPDWLLQHRRRAEQALVSVVATSYPNEPGQAVNAVGAPECSGGSAAPSALERFLQLAGDLIGRGLHGARHHV